MTARLEEIQARCEKASAPPWEQWKDTTDGIETGFARVEAKARPEGCGGSGPNHLAYMIHEEDAAFIAHAREDVPWLLQQLADASSRLATLEGEKAALEAEIAAAREACPVVRMEKYADAPLQALINEEISQLFAMQARAEAAEARLRAYGRHKDDCFARMNGVIPHERECTCGFSAVKIDA